MVIVNQPYNRQIDLFSVKKFNGIKSTKLNSIIKWAGGKELELRYILPKIPQYFNKYYDPFVGGGAVYFSINSKNMYINDKSKELTTLYELIQNQDNLFFEYLTILNCHWRLIDKIVEKHSQEFIGLYKRYTMGLITKIQAEDFLTEFIIHNADEFNGILESAYNIDIDKFIHEIITRVINKITRMKIIEDVKGQLSENDITNNFESALKSSFYSHFRNIYNQPQKYKLNKQFSSAIFYFIREFCYSSMFRYNSRGEFNVPYGGIQYNRKDFLKKIQSLKSIEYQSHLENTMIFSNDFEEFLNINSPSSGDFIFFDPPYDSEFKSYANDEFTRNDHIRLANYINNSKAMIMLVIKNTEFILNLYSNHDLNITSFDKKYLVSFQDRNDKNSEHLIITNY
jgi:DNA adenine methylase